MKEITYLIREQENLESKGKTVEAFKNGKLIGGTGYINKDNHNALLNYNNDIFSIFVRIDSERKGIGSELMSRLIEQLAQDNFVKLMIEEVLPSSKKFYDKIFNRLEQETMILGYNCQVEQECAKNELPSYNYQIIL